jgi:hypothetical protein
MPIYKKSKPVTDTSLLSERAKTTSPRQLSEYVKSTDIQLSNLLQLLPSESRILDVSQSWSVKEYNAQGPSVYMYDLWVYYAGEDCVLYTHHTYSASIKCPSEDTYCLDPHGPRKLSKHSPVYMRLLPYCKGKSNAMNTSNAFAVFTEDSE